MYAFVSMRFKIQVTVKEKVQTTYSREKRLPLSTESVGCRGCELRAVSCFDYPVARADNVK
jgi:hypothetical protein